MINKGIYVLVITFCVSLFLSLSACSTKQGPINDLSDLAEEVQANGSNYSAEEWKIVKEELEVIDSEIEQYKDEELKEIGRLKGILLAQYTKASVKSITSGVENAMKEAEGLVDGFLDGFFQ